MQGSNLERPRDAYFPGYLTLCGLPEFDSTFEWTPGEGPRRRWYTLLAPGLGVEGLVRLSRRTYRIIRKNLFWALFYDVVAVPVRHSR